MIKFILIALTLSACGRVVIPDHYKQAEIHCEKYGGVSKFFPYQHPTGIGSLICNNGTTFSTWYEHETNNKTMP